MYAILAPGQGAQTPRMLFPWLRDPHAADLIDSWSEAAGVDLGYLGTQAGAEEIAQTENTQPLLVAQALLAASSLPVGSVRRLVAGHSVGELAAAVFAGTLRPRDAVRLARTRGLAMARACALVPTTMAAVVGGEAATVLAHLRRLGLTAANHNGAGQVVAAGAVAAIEELHADPPAGTAVRPLAVAGAFHTAFMEPARETFAAAAADVEFANAVHPLVSNLDGRPILSGGEIRERLVRQITAPVRWDRCLATIDSCAPSRVIAAPPGRILAGIMARQLPHVRTISVVTPRDLDGAVAAVEDHREAPALVGAGV